MKDVFKFVMKRQYILWPLLALVYFFVSKSAISLDDYVFTAGDDPGYQIIACNFVNGHGVMVRNIYDSPKNYRFDNPDEKYYKVSATGERKVYYFYRTPGYPIFFLGSVYYLFGTTSPYIGKLAALFLLCLVAGGMPWLAMQIL